MAEEAEAHVGVLQPCRRQHRDGGAHRGADDRDVIRGDPRGEQPVDLLDDAVGRLAHRGRLRPDLSADDEALLPERVEDLLELVGPEPWMHRPRVLLLLDDPPVEVDQVSRRRRGMRGAGE